MVKRIKKDPFYENESATEQNKEEDKQKDYIIRSKERKINTLDPRISSATRVQKKFSHNEISDENIQSRSLKLNRKQKKQQIMQLLYENLKLQAPYPHLVEFEDVGCTEPFIYNRYKNIEGSLPVPQFWKYKHMKYRSLEFTNPFYDKDVQTVRDAYFEHYDNISEKDLKNMTKYPSMTKEYKIKAKTMKNLMKRPLDKFFNPHDHEK